MCLRSLSVEFYLWLCIQISTTNLTESLDGYCMVRGHIALQIQTISLQEQSNSSHLTSPCNLFSKRLKVLEIWWMVFDLEHQLIHFLQMLPDLLILFSAVSVFQCLEVWARPHWSSEGNPWLSICMGSFLFLQLCPPKAIYSWDFTHGPMLFHHSSCDLLRGSIHFGS